MRKSDVPDNTVWPPREKIKVTLDQILNQAVIVPKLPEGIDYFILSQKVAEVQAKLAAGPDLDAMAERDDKPEITEEAAPEK
jgi:hypothetical protein